MRTEVIGSSIQGKLQWQRFWPTKSYGPLGEGSIQLPWPLQPLLETWASRFLRAMRGLLTGHLQLSYTFMTSCHCLTLNTPHSCSLCLCFFSRPSFFSPTFTNYASQRSPNKCALNSVFIARTLMAVDCTRNEACSFAAFHRSLSFANFVPFY